jgi:hypothetical protein
VANTQQLIAIDSINSAVAMYPGTSPAIKGSYVFSLANVAGTVASNNIATLFNPVGSGKIIVVGGAFISTAAGAASSSTVPLRGMRITAHSAGTLQANSTYAKFDSTIPNSIAEVRTGNPTITAGSFLWNTPPAVTSGMGGGQFVHIVTAPGATGILNLREGEGICAQVASGTTAQVWNISYAWAEI